MFLGRDGRKKSVQGEVQTAIMKAREAHMDKIKVRLKSCDMRSARKRGTKTKKTKKTHTQKQWQAYLQRGVILVRQLWLELKIQLLQKI